MTFTQFIAILGAIAVLIRLNRMEDNLVSTVKDLQDALAASDAIDAAGFAAVADALEELTADEARQNGLLESLKQQVDNPGIKDQIDQLKTESETRSSKLNAVAQAIREAIPTPAPEPDAHVRADSDTAGQGAPDLSDAGTGGGGVTSPAEPAADNTASGTGTGSVPTEVAPPVDDAPPVADSTASGDVTGSDTSTGGGPAAEASPAGDPAPSGEPAPSETGSGN